MKKINLKHFEFYSAMAATLSIACFIGAAVVKDGLSSVAYANEAETPQYSRLEGKFSLNTNETIELTVESDDVDTETVEESISEFETVEQGEELIEEAEVYEEFNTYSLIEGEKCVVSIYDTPSKDGNVIGYISYGDVVRGYEYDDSFIQIEMDDDFAYISLDNIEEYNVDIIPIQENLETITQFTLSSPIKSESGLTISDIAHLLEGTNMEGYEYLYYNAEKVHGINAYFMLAVSQLESGWGKSDAALNSNNLFGIKTKKSTIKYFSSKDECCDYWVSLIERVYIGRGLDTPETIGPVYCNARWSGTIVDYMNDLVWFVEEYRNA